MRPSTWLFTNGHPLGLSWSFMGKRDGIPLPYSQSEMKGRKRNERGREAWREGEGQTE